MDQRRRRPFVTTARGIALAGAALAAAWLIAAQAAPTARSGGAAALCPGGLPPPARDADDDMVWIPAGSFAMGSEGHYAEEAPTRRVAVAGFWIDRHPVTNAEFARFVAATGYVTVAERVLPPDRHPDLPAALRAPGAAVFVVPARGGDAPRDPASWWRYMPGADWRHPAGPGSSVERAADHPVVNVAFADALAYARWLGHDLPSEAEWEFAARGGLDGAEYVWGDEPTPGGKWMANTWQGRFPFDNTGEDGFVGLAPVGCYPPNGYGLHDMAGNVW